MAIPVEASSLTQIDLERHVVSQSVSALSKQSSTEQPLPEQPLPEQPLPEQPLPEQPLPDSTRPPIPLPDDLRGPEPPVLDIPQEALPADVMDSSGDAEDAESFSVSAIRLLGMSLDPSRLVVERDGLVKTVSERIAALENRPISLEDLLALRSFITEAYRQAGYVTSGAFIPQQTFQENGTVDIQIVEGDVEAVEIVGLTRLRRQYVRDRLRLSRPLRQSDIEQALQLLQQDPLIERVNAQLLAGSGPGLSVLSLQLEEAGAWQLGLRVDNQQTPDVGTEQISSTVGLTNLLGVGDRIEATYRLTRGLDGYSLSYSLPVNASNGRLTVSMAQSQSRLVSSAFDNIDISGNSRTWSLGVRQPVFQTPTEELALGLSFDYRRSQTFLNDVPFSFSPGPDEGESVVSVVRFSQDWLKRTPSQVLAARSQFSLGTGLFGATTHAANPDGQFLSWRGQFQWVQQLPESAILVTRFNGQLTPNQLLPLEQFSLGGVRTVRGYAENQTVSDNGVAASVEVRLPLGARNSVLRLAPFVEGGIGWDSGDAREVTSLLSIGSGLIWEARPGLNLRLDYGLPLINVEGRRSSLQESGLTLSVDWNLND